MLKREAGGFWLALLLSLACRAEAATILLYPYATGFNSRLVNMEKMSKILVQEGHSVSMLISAEYDERRSVPGVQLLRFPSPGVGGLNDPETVENLVDISLAKFSDIILTQQLAYCDSLLGRQKLMHYLKRQHYDLFILDYIDSCGRILIDFVDVPSVLFSNFGFSMEPEIFAPMPLSYTPMPLSPMSNEMTFFQRVRNVVEYGLTMVLYKCSYLPAFQELRQKYDINVSLSLEMSYARAQLVMVNTQFGLDYPRPHMPNVIPIGGLFNEEARPLQGELRDFVETAPYGVVVVSFGSIIDRLPSSKAEIMARTFARLPKLRFVWRLKGRRPDGLSNNTLLMDWLPQNDLLGHQNTVLFVSHCGISSVHESIYHAVPVVAMPMIIDQFYQAAKLAENVRMAVQLSWATLTEDTLRAAIVTAVNDKRYQRNARRLSQRLRHRAVTPRATFLSWVNHILLFGNADHLNSGVVHRLPWFEYFLLDVGLFLAFITALTLYFLKTLLTITWKLSFALVRACIANWRIKQKVNLSDRTAKGESPRSSLEKLFMR